MGCGQSKKKAYEAATLNAMNNTAGSFFESFLQRYAFIDFQQDQVSSKALEFEVNIDKIQITKLAKKVSISFYTHNNLDYISNKSN